MARHLAREITDFSLLRWCGIPHAPRWCLWAYAMFRQPVSSRQKESIGKSLKRDASTPTGKLDLAGAILVRRIARAQR